ncbi:MAG TPA: hypothetical protein VNW99_02305 [Cytophagaceae bacterium]|jgi:hypothetical protein|nr:hypothetical protein [Cytophagaceae bacterium]
MNEQDKHLRKAIMELPSYEPATELWSKIEKDLSFDNDISKSLLTLPEFDAQPGLWDNIENALDKDRYKIKRRKNLTLAKYISGIAAAITFIILGLEVMLGEKSKPVEISYTEEVMYDEHRFTPAGADKVGDDAIQFIKKNCEVNNEICETPEFVELKTQLDELDAAISQLDIAVKKYGKDPDLIRTQIKLENLKSQVTKELIQKLNS